MDDFKPWGMQENAFLMLMHLSQLLIFVVPFAGISMPIVMWATNKDKSKEIDRHGKTILNWLISWFIYVIICTILIVIYIGALGLTLLLILTIAFAIMGGINANKGILWQYPLSIKFLSLD